MSDSSPKWYRRLADVPGLDFSGGPGVDRARLWWASLTPEIHAPLRDFPNQRPEDRLWWTYPGGHSTTESPADRHWGSGPDDRHREEPAQLERRLYEAIELPGTISDYHFIVMAATSSMELLARDDPALLTQVEEFCLLDLRITGDHPELFTWTDKEGDTRHLRVTTCDILARLYRQEAAVAEWLEVEEQAARLSQGDPDAVRRLIAELEADAG
jgi:hypothetical protein